jgi:hypothetical protein
LKALHDRLVVAGLLGVVRYRSRFAHGRIAERAPNPERAPKDENAGAWFPELAVHRSEARSSPEDPMTNSTFGRRPCVLTLVAVAASLSGCGGNDPQSASPALIVACTGPQCGVNADQYTGSGLGAWQYTNNSTQDAHVPVRLWGLDNSNVTLVFTNVSDKPATLAESYVNPPDKEAPSVAVAKSVVTAPPSPPQDGNPRWLDKSNAKVLQYLKTHRNDAASDYSTRRNILHAAPLAYVPGSKRDWMMNDEVSGLWQPVPATLRAQRRIDGYNIDIWVADNAFGPSKVSQEKANLIAESFAGNGGNGIYAMGTELTQGKPWGKGTLKGTIGPQADLHIVIADIGNSEPGDGTLGYFASLNNLVPTPDLAESQHSNQALMFVVDAVTLGCYGPGANSAGCDDPDNAAAMVQTVQSTLAHEFVHMINFYQRGMVMSLDSTFEPWLEEITAMMLQDFVDPRLFPNPDPAIGATQPLHSTMINRVSTWYSTRGYRCNVAVYDIDSTQCMSYPVGASFGGYLLRQYGVKFYQALLRRPETDLDAVDGAIRVSGGPGVADAIARWSSVLAMPSLTQMPAGTGFPQRVENGYTLVGLKLAEARSYLNLERQTSKDLPPNAHQVIVRQNVNRFYAETVKVPLGVALSVYVD